MFCSSCGTQLMTGAVTCPSCGKPVANPPSAASSGDIGSQIQASARDAVSLLKTLATDPVGALPAAYAGLGADRSTKAGAALCVFFALAGAIGVTLGVQQWFGQFAFAAGGGPGIGGFVKIVFYLLVLSAAMIGVSVGARRVSGVKNGVAPDVFGTGAALAPLAIGLLIAGVVGMANLEVASLVLFFAFVYLVLILHAGLTKIGQLSERAAAPTVAVVIVLASWVFKVVFAAL